MKRVAGVFLCLFILSTPLNVTANSQGPVSYEDVPPQISQDAEIIGNKFNICPELLIAIAFTESSYDTSVTNGGCKGLMQVSTSVHADRFTKYGWTVSDWDNPYINMYVAGDYLSELFEMSEDVAEVLYLYNGDSTGLKKYKQSGYLSPYVSRILDIAASLERQNNK